MKKLGIALVTAATALSLVACPPGKQTSDATPDVVARVGDQVITKAQFDKQVEKSLSRYRSLGRVNQPAIEVRIKQNVLRRMVDNLIYETKAAAMNLKITEAQVQVKLAEHKKRFGGDEAFEEYLKRTHNSLDELKDDIRYNLLREQLVEKLGGDVAVTNEEVKEHFEKNKQRYVDPEQVKASHILFKLDKAKFLNPEELKGKTPEQRRDLETKALEKAKAEALAKAQKVLPLAKKPGADFAALAKKYSEGPTAPKGGDLGFFTARRMVKPFSDKAFVMKPNEISDLVETRFGYHIIKVFEHKDEVQKPFEEVADSIRKSLESRKRNEKRREVLKQLKDEVKVETMIKFDKPAPTMPSKKMPNMGDRSGMRPNMPRSKVLGGRKLPMPPGKTPMAPQPKK